jgi:PhnB protein
MQPTAYLFFPGNCAEALKCYADVFGGEIIATMPASELPPEYPIPDDRKNWVLHATLKIGDGHLMASDDVFLDASPMAGCAVNVSLPSVEKAKAAFDALAQDGEIEMAFEPTFWAAGFGSLTDRFGIKWMIGTDE